DAGRAIYASLAGLRGREALASLSHWGTCRFAFDRASTPPMPNLTAPQQAVMPPRLSQPAPEGMRPEWWNALNNLGNMSGSQPGHLPPPSPRSAEGSDIWEMLRGGAPTADNYAAHYDWPASGGDFPNNGKGRTATPSRQFANQSQRLGQPPIGDALRRRPRRAPDVRDLMTV